MKLSIKVGGSGSGSGAKNNAERQDAQPVIAPQTEKREAASTEQPILVLQKVLRPQAKPNPPVSGTLALYANRIVWEPDAPGATIPRLSIPTSSVSGVQRSKDRPASRIVTTKGPVVLQFSGSGDNEAFYEELAPLATPPEEQVARKSLLESDGELRNLYNRLVPAHISAAEFWATRRALVHAAMAASRVTKGLPSASFVAVASGAAATGGGVSGALTSGTSKGAPVVSFQLNIRDIHQVFSEQPAVRRAFLRDVPSKMSETEFWRRYLELRIRGNTTYFEDLEKETLDISGGSSRMDQQAATGGIGIVSPSSPRSRVPPEVDLITEHGDRLRDGYGLARTGVSTQMAISTEKVANASQLKIHPGSMGLAANASAELASERRLLSALNVHGAVVLRGDAPTAGEDAIAIAKRLEAKPLHPNGASILANENREIVVGEDIEVDHRTIPLEDLVPCVSRRTSQSRDGSNGLPPSGFGFESDAMAQHEPYRPQKSEAVRSDVCKALGIGRNMKSVDSLHAAFDAAMDVEAELAEFRDHKRQRRSLMVSAEKLGDMRETTIPSDVLHELQNHAVACHETLRYFWACYLAYFHAARGCTIEVRNTRQRRLKRAVCAVNSRYDALEAIRAKLDGCVRATASDLINPLLHGPMDAAVDAARSVFPDEAFVGK